MAVSQQRLAEAAGRFVVNKGSVDAAFGQKLWSGPFTSSDGTVLAPVSYAGTQWSVSTMSDALMEIHNRDANTVVINNVASHNSEVRDGIIFTPAVALNDTADTAFQVQYELLPSGNQVRAMVTGYDFGYSSRGRPITRRIVQDFTLIKRVNAAIVSPSKVMIGKNVMVQGDLGAAYSDTGQQYGDPLVVKSDFWGLEPGLDAELTKLFNALATYDVNKDNRLRIGHPVEGPGIPNYSNLGYSGNACDVTGDGYVDEFDVFIMYYDHNHDGKVTLSAALTAGTPAAGQTPEFVQQNGQPVDDDLALLIDSAHPDRNKNGVYSFTDQIGRAS